MEILKIKICALIRLKVRTLCAAGVDLHDGLSTEHKDRKVILIYNLIAIKICQNLYQNPKNNPEISSHQFVLLFL